MKPLEKYRGLEQQLLRLRTVTGLSDPPGADAILDDMEAIWEELGAAERELLNSEGPRTFSRMVQGLNQQDLS